jgi:predicted O-methyltransferase YrrM
MTASPTAMPQNLSPSLRGHEREFAAFQRTLRERVLEPGQFAEFFASSTTGGELPVGVSGGDLRKSSDVLRAAGVRWDLRARAAASIFRHRRPWQAVRAAVHRQNERNIRRSFPRVHEAQSAARADGGFSSPSQFSRLWELALLIEMAAPRSCLEFGTGASTAMLAERMAGRGTLVSVEESPYWHSRLQEYIHRFAGGAESIQVDRVVTKIDGAPVAHYDMPHDRYYDFVYVDGPSNDPPPEWAPTERELVLRFDDRGRIPNADIELMWNCGIFPRTIVLDGRLGTLRRWMRTAAERYDVVLKPEYYAAATGLVPDYFLHHTILQLRERMTSGT